MEEGDVGPGDAAGVGEVASDDELGELFVVDDGVPDGEGADFTIGSCARVDIEDGDAGVHGVVLHEAAALGEGAADDEDGIGNGFVVVVDGIPDGEGVGVVVEVHPEAAPAADAGDGIDEEAGDVAGELTGGEEGDGVVAIIAIIVEDGEGVDGPVEPAAEADPFPLAEEGVPSPGGDVADGEAADLGEIACDDEHGEDGPLFAVGIEGDGGTDGAVGILGTDRPPVGGVPDSEEVSGLVALDGEVAGAADVEGVALVAVVALVVPVHVDGWDEGEEVGVAGLVDSAAGEALDDVASLGDGVVVAVAEEEGIGPDDGRGVEEGTADLVEGSCGRGVGVVVDGGGGVEGVVGFDPDAEGAAVGVVEGFDDDEVSFAAGELDLDLGSASEFVEAEEGSVVVVDAEGGIGERREGDPDDGDDGEAGALGDEGEVVGVEAVGEAVVVEDLS